MLMNSKNNWLVTKVRLYLARNLMFEASMIFGVPKSWLSRFSQVSFAEFATFCYHLLMQIWVFERDYMRIALSKTILRISSIVEKRQQQQSHWLISDDYVIMMKIVWIGQFAILVIFFCSLCVCLITSWYYLKLLFVIVGRYCGPRVWKKLLVPSGEVKCWKGWETLVCSITHWYTWNIIWYKDGTNRK